MTAPRDPDRLIRAFLEEGPAHLSEQVVERTLGEIHRSHRRAVFGPWRNLPMPRASLAAIAAVLVLGAVVIFAMRATTPVGSVASPGPNASGLVVASTTPAAPTPSSAAPASPSPTAASGTIVYELNGSIFGIGADGTNNHPLVTRQSCCIALAPEGQAFIYGVEGPNGPTKVGYVGRAGDNEPDLIPPAGVGFAPGAWSSKNDLAFAGSSATPSKNGIYLSIDNGGGLLWGTIRHLTTPTGGLHDVPIAFSQDGSRLLFMRAPGDSETGDLYVINEDGSGLRRLTPRNVAVEVDAPFGAGASWSPDGSQIAFAGFTTPTGTGVSSIYVVSATSGSAKAITAPNQYSTSARWSPNAAWIAFDQPQGGGSRHYQYLIHPDGSGLTEIGQGLNVGVCCSQWSPDGTMLVTQGGLTSDVVDLYIIKADGSGAVQLTHNAGRYDYYLWSAADL